MEQELTSELALVGNEQLSRLGAVLANRSTQRPWSSPRSGQSIDAGKIMPDTADDSNENRF